VRHFPGKEKAQRYATDREYCASLARGRLWEMAKGKWHPYVQQAALGRLQTRYAAQATGFWNEATANCSKAKTLHRSHPIASFPF